MRTFAEGRKGIIQVALLARSMNIGVHGYEVSPHLLLTFFSILILNRVNILFDNRSVQILIYQLKYKFLYTKF